MMRESGRSWRGIWDAGPERAREAGSGGLCHFSDDILAIVRRNKSASIDIVHRTTNDRR